MSRRPGRPPAGHAVLTEPQIIAAALDIIDREGVNGLSMRRLARALDVDPMAIYRHLPDKSAVLRGVVDEVFAEFQVKTPPDATWQTQVMAFAEAYLALAQRHPNLVLHLVVDVQAGAAAALAANETLYAALLRSGLPPTRIVQAADAIVDYLNGFVLALGSGRLGRPDERDELRGLLETTPEEQYPAQRRVWSALDAAQDTQAAQETQAVLQDQMRRGLELILAGIQAQLAMPENPSAPAPDPAALDLAAHSEAQLLGEGGEAQVYALDAQRVLRLYRKPVAEEYLHRCRVFYAGLRAQTPRFDVPQILAFGRKEGRVYAIERRLAGQSFAVRLPQLSGEARYRALYNYLTAALEIGALHVPHTPVHPDEPLYGENFYAEMSYGEVLSPAEPVQAAAWRDYLHARMEATLAASYPDLAEDVPGLPLALRRIHTALDQLPETSPSASPAVTPAIGNHAALVHGDYGPANVLMDEALNVTAVLDFGYATLRGDPRLDLAAALAFMELTPGYRAADSEALRTALAACFGDAILPVLQTYRLYYAVYFSRTKADDPATYAWCAENLRAAARAR